MPYGFCELLRFLKPILVGIAYGKPLIVIVDNNDFKTDMLTDNATSTYRTKVLYVQPELNKGESNNDLTTAQNVTKKDVLKESDVK